MKKMTCFFVLVLFVMMSIIAAGYVTGMEPEEEAFFEDAVKRVDSLGILSSNNNSPVTREQFVKAMVVLSGFGSLVEQYKEQRIFSDTIPGTSWSGYINIAFEKGLIEGKKGETIRPYMQITFSEACDMIIRAIGKKVGEAGGSKSVQEARELGLTSGILLRGTDTLPKWAAAAILDRFWLGKLAKNEPEYMERINDFIYDLSSEYIIIHGTSSRDFAKTGCLLTDGGYFRLLDDKIVLKEGKKFTMFVYGDFIVKVYDEHKLLKCSTIKNIHNNTISYVDGDHLEEMLLPRGVSYFYDSTAIGYNRLGEVIKTNSVIIFDGDFEKIGHQRAIIVDPVYSAPEIVHGFQPPAYKIGNIYINERTSVIVKNGKYIKPEEIKQNDVVYEVTNIFGSNKYMEVFDDKVEGEITDVKPTILSPSVLQVNDKDYLLSPDFDVSALNNRIDSLGAEDKVTMLLGYDGKVVAVQPISYELGPFEELIVMGGTELYESISDAQVMTDQGVYNLAEGIALEPGYKYKLVVEEDTIVKVCEVLSSIEKVAVTNYIEGYLTYRSQREEGTLALHRNVDYCYNGTEKTYDELVEILQMSSSVILGYNKKGVLSYAAVYDPVYSKPEMVADGNWVAGLSVGSITFSEDYPMVREGKRITAWNLYYYDVVYEISDIWGENKYYLAIANNVTGYISTIEPSQIAPKAIVLSTGKKYEFSRHMNWKKINATLGAFSVGDGVRLIFGYDGKVIDMVSMN